MINYNNIKKINGWCSDQKIEKMINLIIDKKPTNLVEIGVYAGKSLICQALALKENGFGKIYGIDSWNVQDCIEFENDATALDWWKTVDLEYIYQDCVKNIKENEVENYIQIIREKSNVYIKKMNYEIDILHIDGNHCNLSSCRDVDLYLPKVKSGGYIWFDDALWATTQDAIKLIETQYNCKLIDRAYWGDNVNFCNLYVKL